MFAEILSIGNDIISDNISIACSGHFSAPKAYTAKHSNPNYKPFYTTDASGLDMTRTLGKADSFFLINN
ncbi:MAG TPA: hypothetical protein DEG17_07930 [Cyanobacteria bacterium UBA11149]|nr:hypothetical protein [Cyanobacteria bacterium UBA11166]HBR75500.1 hypothetical protein [Cyanobacteria bacterium UBA11159]HBW88790.1 hypothetical protein [Cyanobacteria bacterium UBA11149]HCA98239.1 hypothetical protein [Cyanobacteria bacterium UBA9226]